jgi:Na+-translocating ferredoxin:NAD+ oxidoreductase subunit A
MSNLNLFALFFTMMIIQNFIVAQFLGLCPFFGVTKKLKDAISMAAALSFVLICSAMITWVLTYYVLIPYDVLYMNTVVYILVIATFVQIVELFIRRTNLTLYNALGIYLPLITVHCAVLGTSVINVREGMNFIQAVIVALGGAVGVVLLMAIMAGIREKMDLADVPVNFRGLPIAIFVAALLGLSFFGFGGIV